jgi:NADP-dependent 3-hydroxy acid dehydrogenase YdfG
VIKKGELGVVYIEHRIETLEVVMKSLVWFITGASRGFGLEIARAALERGDAVGAAVRDSKVVERVLGQHE